MRKLAREAVIFMLLGGVVGAAVLFSQQGNHDVAIILAVGFVFGLGGGLVVWALYRMVRFAITG
jgi:hypothetical protein